MNNDSLNSTDKANIISSNVVPPKLLRIEISDYCNYNCTFCCWPEPKDIKAIPKKIEPQDLKTIAQAMVQTDCHNFHFTGGEPLLHKSEYLCQAISAITSTKGVEQFWITTNGSILKNEKLCKELYAAGLRRVNMSIAAETNEKYGKYSRSTFNLDSILKSINNATQNGLTVQVHVPLNTDGVSTFEELETLLQKAQMQGANEAFYFNLHLTPENENVFQKLYVDPNAITEGFLNSPNWELKQTQTKRNYFTNGKIKINVPRKNIHIITPTCKENNCGDYCQGIYAAYLLNLPEGLFTRACHRSFEDKRNLFEINKTFLGNKDVDKLTETFRSMWKYAYGS